MVENIIEQKVKRVKRIEVLGKKEIQVSDCKRNIKVKIIIINIILYYIILYYIILIIRLINMINILYYIILYSLL